MKKENIEDYKPTYKGYGKNAGRIFEYEKNWFCQENYIIHGSEKAVLNCPHCSQKYYKP